MNNPKALENIEKHKVKPGEVKNPHGRPKGSYSVQTKLREIMSQKVAIDKDPITGKANVKKEVREVIALKLAAMAMKGDIRAIREVNERTDGKTHIIIEVEASQQEKMQRVEILDKLTKIAADKGMTIEQLCQKEGITLEKYRV